jgi:magnesium transporter
MNIDLPVAVELEQQLNADFMQHYPVQAAKILAELNLEEAVQILDRRDATTVAAVLSQLSTDQAQPLLQWMDPTLATAVLGKLSVPRAALLLRTMKAKYRGALLDKLETMLREDISLLLASPADSAAALMDPRVLDLRPTMLVQDALDMLRGNHAQRTPTQARRTLLLLDDDRRVKGMVAIQDMVLASPGERLLDYMQPVPATVQGNATTQQILDVLDTHGVSSVPVVDADKRLIGIVRHDELAAIAREDVVGDIQAMFGVGRSEHALSSPWFSVRQRMPWLQVNLLTAFAASAVVGLFESTIAAYTALAVLLPVVAGQSGNTGAQALAVVMRGLTLREITLRQWKRVVGKELLVSVFNGVGVALTTALAVFVWSRSLGLTAVIALAMIVSMLIAGITGAAVPLVLTRLGHDPAQSSSIILTTITDVAGFFSFLGIATLFIGTL